MKKSKFITLFILLLSISSCTSYKYANPFKPSNYADNSQNSKISLYINTITYISDDNQKLPVNDAFKNSCLDIIKSSKLFNEVSFSKNDLSPNYYTVDIEVKEKINNFTFGNIFKGFLIGGSLYLLTPALYFKSGYEIQSFASVRINSEEDSFNCIAESSNVLKRKFFSTEQNSFFSKVQNENFHLLSREIYNQINNK